MIEVSCNAKGVSKLLGQAAHDLPFAIDAGLDRATAVVLQQSYRQVQKIYSAPIPTTQQVRENRAHFNKTGRNKRIARKNIGGAGKKAWVRTRALAEGEVSMRSGQHRRTIKTVGQATRYANRRHGLGVTWTPKAPALGIVRKNQWRKDAVDITAPQVGPAMRDGMRKWLNPVLT